jgi:CubicO group peptidase (beta-lactamase class C family)
MWSVTGEKFGYHALTFGLFVDELIQRVDPAHRDTDTIFMEEISKPLGNLLLCY